MRAEREKREHNLLEFGIELHSHGVYAEKTVRESLEIPTEGSLVVVERLEAEKEVD